MFIPLPDYSLILMPFNSLNFTPNYNTCFPLDFTISSSLTILHSWLFSSQVTERWVFKLVPHVSHKSHYVTIEDSSSVNGWHGAVRIKPLKAIVRNLDYSVPWPWIKVHAIYTQDSLHLTHWKRMVSKAKKNILKLEIKTQTCDLDIRRSNPIRWRCWKCVSHHRPHLYKCLPFDLFLHGFQHESRVGFSLFLKGG